MTYAATLRLPGSQVNLGSRCSNSPADTLAEVESSPAPERIRADTVLATALGLTAHPTPAPVDERSCVAITQPRRWEKLAIPPDRSARRWTAAALQATRVEVCPIRAG